MLNKEKEVELELHLVRPYLLWQKGLLVNLSFQFPCSSPFPPLFLRPLLLPPVPFCNFNFCSSLVFYPHFNPCLYSRIVILTLNFDSVIFFLSTGETLKLKIP